MRAELMKEKQVEENVDHRDNCLLSPIVTTRDPGHKLVRLQHIFNEAQAVTEPAALTGQIWYITVYDRWRSVRHLGRRHKKKNKQPS
jgi:hypothetical protein